MVPSGTRTHLGRRLRQLRTAAELHGSDLATAIGISQGQLSKIETGKRRASASLVRQWAERCGATADVVDDLVELATQADTDVSQWPQRFAAGWDTDQRSYEELERKATSICSYQVSVVPGLVQTLGYTERILRDVVGLGEDDIAAGLRARRARQQLLYRAGTDLRLVIAEHVLRHRWGGDAVMLEQLHHLAQLAELPTVDLAVLPVDTDMPLPHMTSFDLLTMDRDEEDVVQIETDTSEIRETEPSRVEVYRQRFDALRSHAHTGADALDAVRQIAASIAQTVFHEW